MRRDKVYTIITGERTYQDKVWGTHGNNRGGLTPQDGTYVNVLGETVPAHDVMTWLGYMEHYLAEAKKELTTKQGVEAGLHMMRKAVALGVACFEQHGVPNR